MLIGNLRPTVIIQARKRERITYRAEELAGDMEIATTNTSVHYFEAATLATKSVIVYCDRAEVKRLVCVNLTKGSHEILIQNVSAVIERQSVRVDGRGVMIQEVQYQEMPLDNDTETEKVRELEKHKIELENDKFALEDEISSLRKRIEVLDGVAAQIAAGPPMGFSSAPSGSVADFYNHQPTRRHTITSQPGNPLLPAMSSEQSGASSGFLFNQETLENLTKFLKYYGETISEMKRDLRRKQRECENLMERLDSHERQIDQLRYF
ncbi:unnamed protein product [Caenorhabditis auriculariae]|uniref:DUF4140 domain-containing protein n=1 Tax=Caenorhabditis auriculariae TaxID=2777116 RepID=A0A8S1H821_9PELO|nr:unnamed protein product [Caenorhabditis auriculariae]